MAIHNRTDGVPVAETKTKATNASVAKHIAALPNDTQRADCRALVTLLGRLTKAKPKMWGPSIVGFGSYHYTYDSGREGDSCVAGFAARGTGLVVYLLASSPEQQARLAKLGKHRMGKVCLYIRRLSDVDTGVLERLVAGSISDLKRRYG